MSIYRSAVNKPVTTFLIYLALAILGVFSLVQLPIDNFPDIESNVLMVMSSYPGASAETVANNVGIPLEKAINGIEDMLYMSSNSYNSGAYQLSILPGLRDQLAYLRLADLEMLLTDRMGQRIRRLKDRVAGMERELTLASPQARIRERRLALDHAGEQLKQLMERRIARDRQALSASGRDRYVNAMRAVLFRTRKRLDIDIERLEGGSPVRRLKSGYAHIADAEGRTLRSVRGIRAKDHLTVTMADGALGVSVEEVQDGGKEE